MESAWCHAALNLIISPSLYYLLTHSNVYSKRRGESVGAGVPALSFLFREQSETTIKLIY